MVLHGRPPGSEADKGRHPELKDKVITPDVLLQPHFASLQLAFYNGKQFPAEYHGDIFAGQHGCGIGAGAPVYEVSAFR